MGGGERKFAMSRIPATAKAAIVTAILDLRLRNEEDRAALEGIDSSPLMGKACPLGLAIGIIPFRQQKNARGALAPRAFIISPTIAGRSADAR